MTRLECSTLRCLAIVSIMLHNLAHWLPGAVPENEFSFSLDHYDSFWGAIIGIDFLIQLFSFFGHLGVPVFVFLTGYGLAQKYDRIEHLEWKSFLYNHWKKLFIPLLIGTISYLVVMYIIEGRLVCSISRIIAQCTMLLNFISPMHLLPMPYWYLGMTMQLYIIYLMFVHKRPSTVLLLLIIASLFFMAFLGDYHQMVVLSKFNCIGWIVPLCMGIAYSRYQTKVHFIRGIRLMGLVCMSLALVLICGFNYYAWLLIPLFIVIMSVGIVKYIPFLLQQRMAFLGRNSLYFLIVHPIIRELIMPFVPDMGGYLSLLVYILITFFAVYVFSIVRQKVKI